MTYPPLPTPEIVDGRRLYTAGQMRTYGQACADSAVRAIDASRAENNASGQHQQGPIKKGFGEYSAAVDDLISKMGMKK